MRKVVLLLIVFAQQAQMVFGAVDMIFGRPPDPFIIRMASRAIAHDAGDYLEGLSEWFHAWFLAAAISLVSTLAAPAVLIERALAQGTKNKRKVLVHLFSHITLYDPVLQVKGQGLTMGFCGLILVDGEGEGNTAAGRSWASLGNVGPADDRPSVRRRDGDWGRFERTAKWIPNKADRYGLQSALNEPPF
jgi:hypothetical protein